MLEQTVPKSFQCSTSFNVVCNRFHCQPELQQNSFGFVSTFEFLGSILHVFSIISFLCFASFGFLFQFFYSILLFIFYSYFTIQFIFFIIQYFLFHFFNYFFLLLILFFDFYFLCAVINFFVIFYFTFSIEKKKKVFGFVLLFYFLLLRNGNHWKLFGQNLKCNGVRA